MSRYRNQSILVRGIAFLGGLVFVLVVSVAAAWFQVRGATFTHDSSTVRYSANGTHAFPVSGDPGILSWTRLHWDGSNAVDIFAHHELSMDSPDFHAFKQRHIVAVTGGTARRVDNERGGTAILLHGDDGHVYYYAHLQSSFIQPDSAPEARRVEVGQSLGVMGNTGRWTQYIEPPLHFSVASATARLPGFAPDINAADWIMHHFGLEHDAWPEPHYQPDRPSGPPTTGAFEITRSFAEYTRSEAANPDIASVDLLPLGAHDSSAGVTTPSDQATTVPLVSPLLGEVRVHRTSSFGLRVQVTNRHTDETVVLSGLSSLNVQTGDIVERGTQLGTAQGPVNLMHFHNGQLSDPEAFF